MALPSARSTQFQVLTAQPFPQGPRAALSARLVEAVQVLRQKLCIRGTCKTRGPRKTCGGLPQTQPRHLQQVLLDGLQLQVQQARLVLVLGVAWGPAARQISEQVLRIHHQGLGKMRRKTLARLGLLRPLLATCRSWQVLWQQRGPARLQQFQAQDKAMWASRHRPWLLRHQGGTLDEIAHRQAQAQTLLVLSGAKTNAAGKSVPHYWRVEAQGDQDSAQVEPALGSQLRQRRQLPPWGHLAQATKV